MSTDLQALVDELAGRVDAPTTLEDPSQRMIVHSSQRGPIDAVRRDCILRRTTSPAVVAWFHGFGIDEATGPLRIPSAPERGILGRLCVPVRYGDLLLGFLWLIDDEQRLDVEDVELVARHAVTAGRLMYQDWLSQRFSTDVVRNLLSPSEELREAAAGDLVESGAFSAGQRCVAVVVQPQGVDTRTGMAGVLKQALWAAGRELGSQPALRLARHDHGVVLLPVAGGDHGTHAARAAAARIHEIVTAAIGDGNQRMVTAIGTVEPGLLGAARSYRHARLAAGAASSVPALGDVVAWDELGVFRALTQLPAGDDTVIDRRVLWLLDNLDPETIETLEIYLDLGCDVKNTSARLHVHRATLYYRLRKVEESAGIDLRDGLDRLAVHLGLKLAQLANVSPRVVREVAV